VGIVVEETLAGHKGRQRVLTKPLCPNVKKRGQKLSSVETCFCSVFILSLGDKNVILRNR
jgi:hypothetical protein